MYIYLTLVLNHCIHFSLLRKGKTQVQTCSCYIQNQNPFFTDFNSIYITGTSTLCMFISSIDTRTQSSPCLILPQFVNFHITHIAFKNPHSEPPKVYDLSRRCHSKTSTVRFSAFSSISSQRKLPLTGFSREQELELLLCICNTLNS